MWSCDGSCLQRPRPPPSSHSLLHRRLGPIWAPGPFGKLRVGGVCCQLWLELVSLDEEEEEGAGEQVGALGLGALLVLVSAHTLHPLPSQVRQIDISWRAGFTLSPCAGGNGEGSWGQIRGTCAQPAIPFSPFLGWAEALWEGRPEKGL